MKKLKHFLIPLLIAFLFLSTNVYPLSADQTHLSKLDKQDFNVTVESIDNFTKTLTKEEIERNPHLLDVLNEMRNVVQDSNNSSFESIKAELIDNDVYKSHINDIEKNISLTESVSALSVEDQNQLDRIDALAQEYYNYYIEHGTLPIENEGKITISSVPSVGILSSLGLSFTESGLASRLVTLGIIASVDGPLPVGDFIALVSGVVIIGAFAYNYLSTTTSTAIANNIGVYEGTTYKTKATSALSMTRTITYPNQHRYFAAEPFNGQGGGVIILSPLLVSEAGYRAFLGLDTYSISVTDARNVAQAGSSPGKSPVHDAAHTKDSQGYVRYPNNKPHWHAVEANGVTRKPGHHWYN